MNDDLDFYEKPDGLKKTSVDKDPKFLKDIEYCTELDDNQYKHYTSEMINGVAQ